jgi:OFA family oxalate/formate antiporter-like MFS transporter
VHRKDFVQYRLHELKQYFKKRKGENSDMDFRKKRWISLIAGIMIEALLGIAYAWSVFQAPLMEKYHWTYSNLSVAYTMMYLVTMVFTLLLGKKMRSLLSIRKEVLLGGIIYSAAILGLSLMRGNIVELWICWGVLLSIGTSLSYPVLISYSLELFPERAGLAGGLLSAGYGIGSMIWAPLTSYIYTTTGDISNAFRILGIAFLVGIAALTFLLYEPPAGFREAILSETGKGQAKTGASAALADSPYHVGRREMMKLPVFYMTMLSLMLGLACGGMAISQGSPIVVQKFGMSATAAALVVSMLSASNVVGRLVSGAVSDRMGKVRTLAALHAIMGLSMIGLILINQKAMFVVVLMITIMSYGGISSMVAPVTSALFGAEHIIENYPVTFCAYGLSGFIGPMLISMIRQWTGSYTGAFGFAVAFSVAGLILTSLIWMKMRSKQQTMDSKAIAEG